MIEVAAVLLFLYLVSVVLSWGAIKLVFDDIPPKYALPRPQHHPAIARRRPRALATSDRCSAEDG